ncbi:putative oxidoreductase [Lachnellula willkommii]|uniref:Putative oxidoreductase n=1 Tax=Lachnellula willkommii TaxID=215461 RepID=A0A559MJX5_9HELO|nr:putative oxidoreductase [Lachnellula willkommii]
MASYLITGASRGLGFAMAQDLLSKRASKVAVVFVIARQITPALEELAHTYSQRLVTLVADVTDEKSIQKAALQVDSTLKGQGLDFLINNAATFPFSDGIEKMDDLMDTLKVNVNSVHLVNKTFLPLLRKGQTKTVMNMCEFLLQPPEFMFKNNPGYKISKAAMNMLVRQYSLYHENEGFIFFSICPGWTQTEMGTSKANLTVDQSVTGLLNKLESVTAGDNGKFFDNDVPSWTWTSGPKNLYDGEEMPY